MDEEDEDGLRRGEEDLGSRGGAEAQGRGGESRRTEEEDEEAADERR